MEGENAFKNFMVAYHINRFAEHLTSCKRALS